MLYGCESLNRTVSQMTGGSPNLGGKRPKEKTRLTDYRSCGAIMGELNCLTQQSMEMTVTCETATQVSLQFIY